MRFVVCLAVLLLAPVSQGGAQTISPALPSLRLVDVVAASISDHPQVRIQEQQLGVSQALRQQASAPFNDLFAVGVDRARAYTPLSSVQGFDLSPTSTSDVSASYSRLLRNGVSVRGVAGVQRTLESALVRDGLTTSHTALEVAVPLLRGRGRQVTTSGEASARLVVDSSVLDLRHTTAALMTRVVSSYWGLVAAQRTLTVAAESAARGDRLVENVRALIAADQAPRADLEAALANLADRQATHLGAEQSVIEAREQLILDMGIPPEQFPDAAALDDFPAVAGLPDLTPADLLRIASEARDRRADYAAAKARAESARVLSAAARNGLQPEVTLSLNVGYAGLTDGRGFDRYFAGFGEGVHGPDVVGRITYEFPSQNSQALGRLAEADARVRQGELELGDLARSIHASVIAGYGALRTAILRLEKARQSVDAFEAALEGERDKLALGIGSIVNLLTIEDRLTAASAREVSAWHGYGQALVQFRFATGTLVPLHDPLPAVDADVLTTLPRPLLTAGRP